MERVNLDGIFYDQDGEFIPLTASNGNTLKNRSHMRNTYMELQKKLFEEMLSNGEVCNKFINLLTDSVDWLLENAMILQEKIETGCLETVSERRQMKKMSPEEREKFHMKKLEEAEKWMCLYYAAARDKELMLGRISDCLYDSAVSIYDHESRKGK